MIRRYLGFVACWVSWMFPATASAQNILDGLLGAACEADADCIDGLTCIQASSKALAGRGPARGLCAAGCTTDSDCAVWAAPGFPLQPVCESVAGTRLCLEGCFAGEGASPCHQRADSACQKSGRPPPPFAQFTPGECVPLCGSDAQCAGRHCSPALGLCQDEAVTGDPVGASCDPDASEPTCAGFCDDGEVGAEDGGRIFPVEVFPPGPPFCSQRCVVNGPVGCGWSGEGVPTASCSTVDSDHRPDSVGLCQQLCNCDADCLAPGYACVPGGEIYGAAGTCKPAVFAETHQLHHLPDCQIAPDFGACIYGAVRACKGKRACLGRATCLDDKSGYGDCECLDPGLGQAGESNAGAAAGAESLPGAESVGGAASAGGVATAGGDGTEPSPSGKTPEPGCSCCLPLTGPRCGWLELALLSALFARSRLRRSRRDATTVLEHAGAEP
jgi:hypothetical protein